MDYFLLHDMPPIIRIQDVSTIRDILRNTEKNPEKMKSGNVKIVPGRAEKERVMVRR